MTTLSEEKARESQNLMGFSKRGERNENDYIIVSSLLINVHNK